MEVHVQNLIDSIKKDGVQAAETEAAEIVSAAEKRAKQIVHEAEQKADKIMKETESAQKRREESAKAAMHQAGRDLLLSVEKTLVGMAEELLAMKISDSLKGSTLEKMLLETAKHDLGESGSDIEIPEKLFKTLSKELMGELKQKLSKGVEIKPVKHIDSGFRIAEKKGTGYVSFTSEDLASLLSTYLSPELQKIIHESAQSSS